jgi:putative cell wall-binding protein
MGAPHETADTQTPPPEDASATDTTPPDEAPAVPVSVGRISGSNRYATAAILGAKFEPGGTVFVASGEGFADALAGGPVASIEDAPILLVSRSTVPSETANALDALEPSEIVVLGGTGAVSDAVVDDLSGWAPVTRVAGDNRFATARELALRGFGDGVDNVLVATGRSFADALSGGSRGAAYSHAAPILLVDADVVPAETWEAIDALQPSTITILGGPGVVSDAVADDLSSAAEVVRIAGADRYETSADVAQDLGGGASVLFVATGVNFPDALAAAPYVGYYEGPTLLVPGSGLLPDSTVDALASFTALDEVVAVGGTGALSDEVLEQIYEIVNQGVGQ